MPHYLPAAQVSCDRLHRASDWEKPIGESQSHILRWWRLKNLSVRHLIPNSLNVKPEIKAIDWIEKNFLVFDPRLLSLANLLKPAPLIACVILCPLRMLTSWMPTRDEEGLSVLDSVIAPRLVVGLGSGKALICLKSWFIKNQMIIWG